MRTRAESRAVVGRAATLGMVVLLAGCELGPPSVQSAQDAAEAAATCGGTDAHDKHGALGGGVSCRTCHACGGALAFSTLVLPGGTTTANGQITLGDPTTCSVGCHNPFGAPPRTIAWNAPGPLACTSCHPPVAPPGGPVRSSHPGTVDPGGTVPPCQSCHATTAHLSGVPRLVFGGADVEASCMDCHDGDGWALLGQTPPVLAGYSGADGDFHGERVGTGWDGHFVVTLIPPYVPGQPALRCTSCHDAHASTNAFIFAANVNGVTMPAGQISRAGVGAQVLCASCHAAPRHAGCTSDCHRVGASNTPVDPISDGEPCFYCHGHEGIVNFPSPYDTTVCHCHQAYVPSPLTPPVAISPWAGGSAVPNDPEVPAWIEVTPRVTDATIAWFTSRDSTSYVGYGVGTAGRVAGSGTMVYSHSVTLTGLTEHTTYTFRVRSSDTTRNVAQSPLATFTTAWVNGPLAPALVHQPHVTSLSSSITVTLRWSGVADPNGDPVQYRVQVDDSPTFASPDVDSGWIDATSHVATLQATEAGARHHTRVMARDAAHDLWSPWSTTDWFVAYMEHWEE